jgi:hypothetical protein
MRCIGPFGKPSKRTSDLRIPRLSALVALYDSTVFILLVLNFIFLVFFFFLFLFFGFIIVLVGSNVVNNLMVIGMIQVSPRDGKLLFVDSQGQRFVVFVVGKGIEPDFICGPQSMVG